MLSKNITVFPKIFFAIQNYFHPLRIFLGISLSIIQFFVARKSRPRAKNNYHFVVSKKQISQFSQLSSYFYHLSFQKMTNIFDNNSQHCSRQKIEFCNYEGSEDFALQAKDRENGNCAIQLPIKSRKRRHFEYIFMFCELSHQKTEKYSDCSLFA